MRKLGIIITVCNRPVYLRQFLESFRKLDKLPEGTLVVLVDDASDDPVTKSIIDNLWPFPNTELVRLSNEKRSGIKESIRLGTAECFERGCSVVMNFDPDALLRNDCVDELLNLQEKYSGNLITGFHSTTKNKDGSERHEIVDEFDDVYLKRSVGGINLVFNKELYEKYILPSFNSNDNWDRQACKLSIEDGFPIVCSKESLIQHIGDISEMGHHHYDKPDVAENFKPFHLKNVTLVGVSTNEYEELQKAAEISQRDIKFGEVLLLKPAQVNSKATYNKFVLKELVNYINTPFFILIQADGFIINAQAWTNRFYQYDYIGARWHFKHPEYLGYHISNGGFSFRTRRLHEILRDDPRIQPTNDKYIKNFEEDHNIGKIYRKHLEENYGVRYATNDVADQFSVELYGVQPPFNKYNGSLGFHGFCVDFNDAKLNFIPYRYPCPSMKVNFKQK